MKAYQVKSGSVVNVILVESQEFVDSSPLFAAFRSPDTQWIVVHDDTRVPIQIGWSYANGVFIPPADVEAAPVTDGDLQAASNAAMEGA